MKILVACEESQIVTIQLRNLGHEAYSCDIIECSGNHPEWHIMQDVLPLLNGRCAFNTMDGENHEIECKWDMIIAFPPCTHLAVSGAPCFEKKREDGRQRDGIEFFCKFFEADCDKISIENPVNIISGDYCRKWFPDIAERYGLPIKPAQKIHPYYFGDPFSKTTCLWLKGLPKLDATEMLDKPEGGWGNQHFTNGRYSGFVNVDENGKVLAWNDPRTARIRSKTYPGIAKAMAEQWAGKISVESQDDNCAIEGN
jgi:hypothetical protein